MKVLYDSEVDALSIIFRDAECRTEHIGDGIAIDYDALGRIAAIEILDAARRFGGSEPLQEVHVEGLKLAVAA